MTPSDDRLRDAHRSLVARGVIAALSDDDHQVRRWLDWELASLIEGHFHRTVDVHALPAAERLEWERRVTTGGLRDPRRDDFRRAYWLLHGGERAGTVATDSRGWDAPSSALPACMYGRTSGGVGLQPGRWRP